MRLLIPPKPACFDPKPACFDLWALPSPPLCAPLWSGKSLSHKPNPLLFLVLSDLFLKSALTLALFIFEL